MNKGNLGQHNFIVNLLPKMNTYASLQWLHVRMNIYHFTFVIDIITAATCVQIFPAGIAQDRSPLAVSICTHTSGIVVMVPRWLHPPCPMTYNVMEIYYGALHKVYSLN